MRCRGDGALDGLREVVEFGGIQIGHRPEGHAGLVPMNQVIAAQGEGFIGRRTAGFRPDKEVDEMLLTLIDERGDGAVRQIIQPPADEREALCGEVGDGRGKVQFAIEPRLDGVLVGGRDIGEMTGLERADVARVNLQRQPHVPLWAVYPQWGWGTEDSEQALGLLRRFGSVTVLNGHIHQTVQKIEGNITFHTAMSTAFPQPAPGSAPKPGPMKVPAEKLRSVLGVTSVNYVVGDGPLAVVDTPLAS